MRAAALAALIGLCGTAAADTAPARSGIERAIEARLVRFPGTLGLFALHLETGERIAVNADVRFPTASVIKTAVMVEAFHQIAQGRIRKDQLLTLSDEAKVGGSGVLRGLRAGGPYSVGDLLYLMIAVSDNTAANMLIDLLGTKNVDDRMAAYGLPEVRLYRATFRGGKPDVFPEEEREFGLGSATPRQTALLLELIARGRAVSPDASAQMLALLREQQDRDMIPRRLPEREDVVVAGKSGTDTEKLPDAQGVEGAVRNDAAVVSTPAGRYVVAIFTRRVKDTRWTVDNEALLTGAEISRMVYDHFTNRGGSHP